MITPFIQNLTDEQLVAQYQATSNNTFFGEIYNRYYQKVYHTCLGMVKDRDAACDLVHDVMLKVLEKLPGLQNGFLLGLWIHRITKNQCIDFCKIRKSRSYIPLDNQYDLAEEVTDMEALLATDRLFNHMEVAMHALSEEDHQILQMKYFEKCSINDLRSTYGLSESAAKMRLARARKRMVRLYQKEFMPTQHL